MNYFNNEKNSYNQKIYKSELFNVGGNLNPLFIENNTIVIGVFIRTYKYDKGLNLYNNIKNIDII